MNSPRARLLSCALLLVTVAGCGTDTETEPASAPAETAPETDVAAPESTPESAPEPAPEPADAAGNDLPAGVPVSGEGWSATFPGEPEQFVEEVPLPDLDIILSTDVTVWDAGNEALAVMLAQLPIDETSPSVVDEMRAQLFSTAAGMGTIIEDSPLLDSDGTFRGRDAVVVTDAPGELNALMFVEGATLFQVIHVSDAIDGGAALQAFVGGLTLSDATPAVTPAQTDDDGACTTSLAVTTPEGETSTLTSANIQTIYGGEVITVFAADFPIEGHDVPGRPPTFPTDDGLLVWLDLGGRDIDSDAPLLTSGDTATLPGMDRTAFAASLITAERMNPLFGEDLAGSIELRELSDDGACIAIDVTIAGVQFLGTAATDSVLRGD